MDSLASARQAARVCTPESGIGAGEVHTRCARGHVPRHRAGRRCEMDEEMTSEELNAALRSNRYLVFAGDNYYPCSDCADFRIGRADRDEAVRVAKQEMHTVHGDWWCVFDAAMGRVVESGSK